MFENLPDKLKTLRVNSNLSRKQIAELIGVSVSMVGLYESGERLPSLHIIVKLATQYKVSVDYLLDCNTFTAFLSSSSVFSHSSGLFMYFSLVSVIIACPYGHYNTINVLFNTFSVFSKPPMCYSENYNKRRRITQ